MSDGQTATEDLRRLALRDGADAFLTVRSYLSTVRKHDQAALDVLKQLFTGTVWVGTRRHSSRNRDVRRRVERGNSSSAVTAGSDQPRYPTSARDGKG